jgi:peptidyl-prolyl cis-trans isomerase A (cyclophilin A)
MTVRLEMGMLRRAVFLFMSLGLLAGCRHQEPTPTASHQELPPTASKNPVAVIHTAAGDMTCELFPKEAPKTVANFIGLAQGAKDWKDASGTVQHNKPLYDGVIFHRVIPNFMIQGGDPTGTGAGDPGFTFEDELRADLTFDRPGRLAMANRGPNTNSSQFFITETEQPRLNPCLKDEGCPELRRGKNTGYTIFGQCDDSSVTLVKQIARMNRDGRDRPYDPVKIQHIDILNPNTTLKK